MASTFWRLFLGLFGNPGRRVPQESTLFIDACRGMGSSGKDNGN